MLAEAHLAHHGLLVLRLVLLGQVRRVLKTYTLQLAEASHQLAGCL